MVFLSVAKVLLTFNHTDEDMLTAGIGLTHPFLQYRARRRPAQPRTIPISKKPQLV